MKKKAKRGKSKTQKTLAQKKRDRKLLEIIERQKLSKQREPASPRPTPADLALKVAQPPKEDEYSIRNVHAELKRISSQLQNEAETDVGHKSSASECGSIAGRMKVFGDFREALVDIDSAECEVVLGFDLGSTSSKVVLRFPYEEGLGAYAVPAPIELRSDNHPYYWTTQLWERADGHFNLCASTESERRNHLKVAFLNKTKEQTAGIVVEEVYVSAYLALMIRQAMGWLWEKLGRSLSEKSIGLSANFGFPAESGGSSPQLERFQNCVDAALRVALSDAPICRAVVERELKDSSLSNREVSVPTLIVPEFIGAVMGYFHSAQKHNGQFMICDFGGLTIDAVCFGFYQRDDGSSLVKIYGSAVKPFGAEVAKIAIKKGVPPNKLATAIGGFVCSPLRDSYKKTGYNAPAWGGTMPLFVIGGGRHCFEIQGIFLESERLIKNGEFNTKFVKQDLDLNEELDVSLANGRSCGRLMVAWGLSHSDLDLPEWITRCELPDARKRKRRDVQDSFIGKEQM